MPAAVVRNPRRSARARVCCKVRVISAIGAFEAETEDVGAHGCRLASPRLVQRGQPILVTVASPRMKAHLRVAGRIAWTSELAPWRLGVAFDTDAQVETERWFSQLLAATPGLTVDQRVPDVIPHSAMLYLGPPPRFVVDLTRDELTLLELVGTGTPVLALREPLGERWPTMERTLFSLLAHRYLTLSRGASVHPNAWRALLHREGARPPVANEPWTPGGGRDGRPDPAPLTPAHLPMVSPERWTSSAPGSAAPGLTPRRPARARPGW